MVRKKGEGRGGGADLKVGYKVNSSGTAAEHSGDASGCDISFSRIYRRP